MTQREMINTALFTLLALGGGAVATTMSATENKFTPYLLSVGWLALCVAVIGLVYMFRTAPKIALAAASEVIAGPPPREFVDDDITTEVLRKKVEGRTSLQIDAVTRTYAGKWMRLRGRIRDVSEIYDKKTLIQITPDDDQNEYLARASAVFEPKWFEQVGALNISDWVEVVGKIEKLKGGVQLDESEIVHMGEPPTPAPKPAPKPRAPRKKAAPKPRPIS